MPRHLLIVFFLFAALSPSVGHAQACGPRGATLLQCTTDEGTNEVAVCLEQEYDRIRVLRGPFEGRLKVELEESLNDVWYSIEQADGQSVHELTVYATGGVFRLSATRPTQMSFSSNTVAAVETICDAGSVSPEDPADGIGQLLPIVTDARSRLALCMEAADHRADPVACLGFFRRACGMRHDTGIELCDETELDVWNRMVADAFDAAIVYHDESPGLPSITAQLTAAQELWERSRAADCEFAGGSIFSPFAPEFGLDECLTYYAAHRLRLLEALSGNGSLQ